MELKKKVTALSKVGYPYHPMVWIKLNGKKPFNDIVDGLSRLT